MTVNHQSDPPPNRFRSIPSKLAWRILSIPIFFKIMGIGVLVAIVFGGIILLQARSGTTHILSSLLENRVLTTTELLASSIEESVVAGDVRAIQKHLERAREIYPEIHYAIVRDSDGNVIASTISGEMAQNIPGIPPPGESLRKFENDAATIYEVYAPISSGNAGTIQAGFISDIVSRGIETYTGTVLWALVLCVTIGAGLALLLTTILTRPIHSLMQSADQIRLGRFETRATIYSHDEIGGLATAFNQMAESLNQYKREVQAKEEARVSLLERIVQVQEDERKSISRELHDHLGQSLLAVLLQVQSVKDNESLIPAVCRDVEKSLRQIADEVHRLAWGMRPSILDDYGLDSALGRHIEEVSRHVDLKIDYSFSSPPDLDRLPGRIEVCLFRIAQEAITNIQRHAGASHASVVVLRQLHVITLLIEDDGNGFDLSMLQEKRDQCLGLIGMKERVALLGGSVTLESTPGEGATIRVKIPLQGD